MQSWWERLEISSLRWSRLNWRIIKMTVKYGSRLVWRINLLLHLGHHKSALSTNLSQNIFFKKGGKERKKRVDTRFPVSYISISGQRWVLIVWEEIHSVRLLIRKFYVFLQACLNFRDCVFLITFPIIRYIKRQLLRLIQRNVELQDR